MNLIYRILFKLETGYRSWKHERVRSLLKSCGVDFDLSDGVEIWSPETMVVGHDCCLRGFTFVYASGGVTFGDRVRVAANCVLTSVCHDMDGAVLGKRRPMVDKPIVLEDDVWVGAGSIVCAGVTIGAGAVIGAGSVVTRDIPAGVFAAGSPAKMIRALSAR